MCTREMAIIVPYSVQIQFIGTKKIMNTWHNVSMPTWNYHISALDLIIDLFEYSNFCEL
jgi:hypothetical protein